ncbi:hypothetical protein DK926_19245 [Rhodococcus sp. Eu-32]|uniref:hypothetical protein n=1 Tax=Rhodococcus sp. Eu-32 TaxID=1017319 RepID=UPI000DF13F0A|nr:hypothetical protein [Rhodococcus sp. Eu-32]RRQ26138.1 hypothetical protein DK926_19245 [Rhodococcus sp. Eu-32]
MTITPTVRTALSITIFLVTALIFCLAAAYIVAYIASAPTARLGITFAMAFLAGVNLVLLVISRLAHVTDQPHTHTAPAV